MAEKKQFNRRDFLKIVGASSGLAASGCGRDLPEKLIPYVVQPDEVIPGISTWYSGTCFECGAGCGTLVRVREGRAVKMEGNPAHPTNAGGLCAQGQSALQTVYDPDRIREPLTRDAAGTFRPATWPQAMDLVADAVHTASTQGGEVILLTNSMTGSENALIREATSRIKGLTHLTYDLLSADAENIAAEAVFGAGARTNYDLTQARVIVSFGADYLETYRSPAKLARGWAAGRKPDEHGKISKVYHFEPRLSLTAGNADRWIMNAPGSEERLMRALLKLVHNKTAGRNLSSAANSRIGAVLGTASLESLLEGTGVEKADLERIADELVAADRSVILPGGRAASAAGMASEAQCAAISNLLNVLLGNVGTTLLVSRTSGPAAKDRYQELVNLFNDLAEKKRKVAVMIVAGVNPVYLFPAQAKAREGLSKVGVLVSLATNLDETASFSNVVLPASTATESWLDAESEPGVFSLNQPAMAPLYQTQSLGDTIIALLANKKIDKPLDKVDSYYDYLRAQWKTRAGVADAGFEEWWHSAVEKGGDWSRPVAPLAASALQTSANFIADKPVGTTVPAGSGDTVGLLTFSTVNTFDGSSANRPVLQELPNPISTTVWGTWLEIHPKTAARLGLGKDDVARVVTESGIFDSPVYLTPYVHPDIIAVPLGHGHQSLGRYANNVGADARRVLPVSRTSAFTPFVAPVVHVRKSSATEYLVKLQFSDSQLNRGIARTVPASKLAPHAAGHGAAGGHGAKDHDGHGEGHGGGHHDPLALGPREEAPQMYKQMSHPVYRWGMSIDLATCTGCSACVVACNTENNVPSVGKTICDEGREMAWLRMERYLDGPPSQPVVAFVPMMCQHCANAPCEPVCPVYGTYHTDEGLNSMVYNRCVGTRYCLNNCSYKVRRFNWYKYSYPEPLNWSLNPDVTVREVGVMEKCTFCIQRIREAQSNAKDEGRLVLDGEIEPACASSCATKAIKFGNLKDPESAVAKDARSARSYKVLDVELNTQPGVSYLARITQG